MAKPTKQTRAVASSGKASLAKRYGSIAEIKRDLFPNAAAEEAATELGQERAHESLLNEFFGPQQPSKT